MKPYIFSSSIETSRALILHIVDIMMEQPDKLFNIAFSGGTTPALMYDLWANEYKEITPWERMRVFFTDERCVPAGNSESNFGMVRSLLLSVVPIPYNQVFAIRGSEIPEKEVRRYTELVENELLLDGGLPVFDVVVLGAGADGHTSSIFPGQEMLLSSSVPYAAAYNPSNGQRRITMTGSTILVAHHILFLITGRSKGNVVNEILHSGDTGPAAYIAHHGKDVSLFIDGQAAEKIDTVLG